LVLWSSYWRCPW